MRLTGAIRRYAAGQISADEVASMMTHPAGRPSDPQAREYAGDEGGRFPMEGTFDEVTQLYNRGELSDAQYAELYRAVG